MNANEVVRALKICPGGCKECAYGSVALGCMGKSRLDAADLIESLQAELAESRRRERAAVWKLQSIDWVGSGAKARIEDAIAILTEGGAQAGEE